ncbi:MAG: hypothetical protein HY791_20580 [Deltaproteobacteria bacterium]|nr:hypothetical protein [Deltaproteobacteria bacterium]
MPSFRVALATCAALPGLGPDDRRLLEVISNAEAVVWEDPLAEWDAFDVVLIRSCWDYAFRREVFLEWVTRVSRIVPIHASPAIAKWNTHKSYLTELAARGVPTIKTVVVERGAPSDLEQIAEANGFGPRVVVKAAVAQTGRYLWHGAASDPAGSRHLARVTSLEDALVQPFVPAILQGERSLVFIDGALTHAVEKRPRPGAVLVHDDFGGTVARIEPSARDLEVAAAAIEGSPEPPLYARVDLVSGPDQPLLMELELVEPELFFRFAPEARERLIRGLIERTK